MRRIEPKNILLVKNRAMGDAIMGVSCAQYLKCLYPSVLITFALPKWIIPLFKNVTCSVDHFFPLQLDTISDWYRCWKYLQEQNFDCIHELHQNGRTGKFFKIYSLLHGIPYTFHNHHLKGGTQVHDQGIIKSIIQRDLDGIYSFYGKNGAIPNFLDYCPRLTPASKIATLKKIIFGVVATRQTKIWPLQNYASLAQMLVQHLPDFEIVIPLSKSGEDQRIKAELEAYGLPKNVIFLETELSELALQISQSHAYIGNDTGLKHLAIALGLKTITLFGPEPPLEWHPYAQDRHPIMYLDHLECRTKTAHYCGLSTCDSMICLNQFKVEQVFDRAMNLFFQT